MGKVVACWKTAGWRPGSAARRALTRPEQWFPPTSTQTRIPSRDSRRTRGPIKNSRTSRCGWAVIMFGALVAQGGVTGRGVLEVWYNDDLHRGFIQGLPVVFPLKGTWREWGS